MKNKKYYKLIQPVEAYIREYPYYSVVLQPPGFYRLDDTPNYTFYFTNIKNKEKYIILTKGIEHFELIKNTKKIKLLFDENIK